MFQSKFKIIKYTPTIIIISSRESILYREFLGTYSYRVRCRSEFAESHEDVGQESWHGVGESEDDRSQAQHSAVTLQGRVGTSESAESFLKPSQCL